MKNDNANDGNSSIKVLLLFVWISILHRSLATLGYYFYLFGLVYCIDLLLHWAVVLSNTFTIYCLQISEDDEEDDTYSTFNCSTQNDESNSNFGPKLPAGSSKFGNSFSCGLIYLCLISYRCHNSFIVVLFYARILSNKMY